MRISIRRIARPLLIAVVSPLVILPFVLSLLFVLGANEVRLQIDAHSNVRKLDELTILTGRHETPTASPDGDALTGDSSPAQVDYPVNDTVGELVNEVSTNLSRQGYKASSPYLSDENDGTTVKWIEQSATKGKDRLFIYYTLKEAYDCVPVFTSYNNPEGICPAAVIHDAQLLDRQASEVSAELNPAP